VPAIPTPLDIRVSLDPVLERIESELGRISGELRAACAHLFHAGGKGVRPTLVILSARAAREAMRIARNGTGDPNETSCPDAVYDVAAAAEIIHVASLIHDDVIDGADTRRDRPSVNARWNNHTAVLAGDCLFAAAFRLLAPHAALGAVTLMTEAIADMCRGEVLQRLQAYDPDVTEQTYAERIGGKTAALIAACCEAGARLQGAGHAFARALRDFGRNLGLAYQVVDDVLDFDGSPEKMGKPACADLKEGNLTLPVIYLLRNPAWRDRLAPCIRERRIDADTVALVNDGLRATGALEAALSYGKALAREAVRCLGPLTPTACGRRLAALAYSAVDREA